MILTDLIKAFDRKNHKILLDKSLKIGFPNNSINWYEPYIGERHFITEVANWLSKFVNISPSNVFVSMILSMI